MVSKNVKNINKSKNKPKKKRKQLPCIAGWQLSIRALVNLWRELNSAYGFKYLLTSRLNQDCLENFFSIIRGKGGHRIHPNALQFRSAFRACAVDSLFSVSNSSNCLEDVDTFLLKIKNISSPANAGQEPEHQTLPQAQSHGQFLGLLRGWQKPVTC